MADILVLLQRMDMEDPDELAIILNKLEPSLYSGGENLVLLICYLKSLQIFYSMKKKFPSLSDTIEYQKMKTEVYLYIKSVSQHSAVQMINNDLS